MSSSEPLIQFHGKTKTSRKILNGNSLNNVSFFLERSVPSVVAEGYVVLENKDQIGVYPININGVIETSLPITPSALKATGLSVTVPFDFPALTSFKVRETTAYVQANA